MTRIYNDPAEFKNQMVDGFVSAYGRFVERVPDASGVMRVGGPREGKASVIIGGGSGHYPAFCGVVGAGFADGAVIGDIFTSPSEEQAYRVAKALDGGGGVLFSYGNYAGDVLNFDAAQDRLRAEGIDCRTVIVTDDIASADVANRHQRRGIAGDFPVFKAAGAAGDEGQSLDEVERIANKTNDLTRSFGVAFAGCTFPGRDHPLFTVEPGRMELGLGIHGEPGIRSVDTMPAKELARALVDPLLAERPPGTDGRAAVILNGLGATKYEELFILWRDVVALLDDAGVTPVLPEVGELVTSLDMAGCSLTITWLDDELARLWAAPAATPAFTRGDVATLPDFGPRTQATAATRAERAQEVFSPESEAAAQTARAALAAMHEAVQGVEEELGRLDSVAGDGDHGVGMVRGTAAAVAAAGSAPGGVGSVLQAAGAAFSDQAGGTSGMLWGALLGEFGATLGNTEAPTAARMVEAAQRSVDVVQRRGKANPGDKTMLDAYVPFVDALGKRVGNGADIASAWADALAAADAGARATAEMRPMIGRARPLADRSVGHADPGAVSMAHCLAAVAAVLERDCS